MAGAYWDAPNQQVVRDTGDPLPDGERYPDPAPDAESVDVGAVDTDTEPEGEHKRARPRRSK